MELDSIPVTPILEDNADAAKWCYNPLNHAKQTYIDMAYHFIREQCAEFGNLTIVSFCALPPSSVEFGAGRGSRNLCMLEDVCMKRASICG